MIKNITAYILGVIDGWREPHELSTSANVDHLYNGANDPWEWQDRGINLGQRIHSPLHHQRF